MNAEQLKRAAAEAAIEYVEPGTIIGVGTGSTANYFIDLLAERHIEIEAAVASSDASAERLRKHHIHVMDLNSSGDLPLYVDGADEANRFLQLIKGGGGALTREKIVASASKKFICIADASKKVDALGAFPVPIEVIPMARSYVARQIVRLHGNPVLRERFTTDNGNLILDVHNFQINEPIELERTLNNIAGVVAVGLFALRPADVLILAGSDGVTIHTSDWIFFSTNLLADAAQQSVKIEIERCDSYCVGRFSAMASPCEVLIDWADSNLAEKITTVAAEEAQRSEHKFSRYRDGNIIHRINNSAGAPIEVDTETAQLLDFSEKLYQLSDGLFDVTSGVLRKAWQFDGSDHIPDPVTIKKLLPQVGWSKLKWEHPILTVPTNMQIDLGGIGKEYAVDHCLQLLREITEISCLVNFGGDLVASGSRSNDQAWQIGIESVDVPGQNSGKILALSRGAIATSGDARRFILNNGKRYGHILNPKTGWPVDGAPRSVTVTANTCTEAGMLATFGMLQGENCEHFLDAEKVRYWCLR